MKKLLISILLVFTLLPIKSYAGTSTTTQFSDIDGHWAETLILQAVEKGYVKGYPDGTFKPNAPVKKDELLAMILMSKTYKDESGKSRWENSFVEQLTPSLRFELAQAVANDVFNPSDIRKTKYWAEPYIDLAHNMYIIYNYNYSDWSQNVSREYAAKIIVSTLMISDYPNGEFESASLMPILFESSILDSAKIEDSYKSSVFMAAKAGIMKGFPDKTFKPKNTLTRAEAITIIEKMNDTSLRNPIVLDLSNKYVSYFTSYVYKGKEYQMATVSKTKTEKDFLDFIYSLKINGFYSEQEDCNITIRKSKEDVDAYIEAMDFGNWNLIPNYYLFSFGTINGYYQGSISETNLSCFSEYKAEFNSILKFIFGTNSAAAEKAFNDYIYRVSNKNYSDLKVSVGGYNIEFIYVSNPESIYFKILR